MRDGSSRHQEERGRWAPTWRHPRGDGGGRHLALPLGSHGGHLNGVGGECGEPGHAVLQGHVGQVVGHACVGAVVLLPGDPVAWGEPAARVSSAAVASAFSSAAHAPTSLAVGHALEARCLRGGGSIMGGWGRPCCVRTAAMVKSWGVSESRGAENLL